MFRDIYGRFQVAAWTAILAAAAAPAFGQQGTIVPPTSVEVAARRLADAILDTTTAKQRLPLNSDAEHARTIDPVLTRGAAIWIHDALPAPPLTVIGGRVFSYRDHVYDPLEAPVLKIRAIDDNQNVPFLLRVVINPNGQTSPASAIILSFPAPPVFDASIGKLATWVGGNKVEPSLRSSLKDATFEVRVPIAATHPETSPNPGDPITVIIEGEFQFGSYAQLAPGHFVTLEEFPLDPTLEGLANLEFDRDIATVGERERLHNIGESLASTTTTDYERVVAVNDWVSTILRYRETPASRSPLEALEDRSGDCDDYSALAVALFRTMGIPARQTTGLLYDLDTFAAHAWVEAALATRNGGLHWFIVDPTLAGTTPLEEKKAGYVQSRDRILLYPVRPVVAVEGMAGRRTVDALVNWQASGGRSFTDPHEMDQLIDLVIEAIDRQISGRAEHLTEAGLVLRRESASIAGSPYFLVDRPTVAQGSSRMQLRLENEERLVLDITAAEGSALDSESDLETVDQMRAAYTDLNNLFFGGMQAHHNLELVFVRDPHSDRLHTVSLGFGRYLVEHYLDRILKRLGKGDLLTAEETAMLSAVAEASGGKNLYILQELARQLPINADSSRRSR